MCLLLESIRVDEGRFFNLPIHERRLNDSRRELFGAMEPIDLSASLSIPHQCREGLFKCRVLCDERIRRVEFEAYARRAVRSLKLVYDDAISYSHKVEDKSAFTRLLEQKGECDDILIVKKGVVTDTSFSNIALYDGSRWRTPASPLLRGTKREELISEGVLVEEDISPEDLCRYTRVSLINAMLDLGDTVLPPDAIR
jgi:4-amino-4-deoxychorismate lyase